MRAKNAYISIGANRASSCAACLDDIVAFGAGQLIALWDTKVSMVHDDFGGVVDQFRTIAEGFSKHWLVMQLK
jgi:hypothetical protein